jgi:hypothetical protein
MSSIIINEGEPFRQLAKCGKMPHWKFPNYQQFGEFPIHLPDPIFSSWWEKFYPIAP